MSACSSTQARDRAHETHSNAKRFEFQRHIERSDITKGTLINSRRVFQQNRQVNMVSIKDIAEKAGVSRGTVDRVLHGRGRVAPDTQKLILSLAEEMGYEPSAAGMALAAHKKKIRLGFIGFAAVNAPFFYPVLEAAKKKAKELEQYGVEVVFFTFDLDDRETLKIFVQKLLKEWPDIQGWTVPGLDVLGMLKYFADASHDEAFGNKIDEIIQSRDASGNTISKPVVYYNIDEESTGYWNRIGFVGCDYEHSGRIACGLASKVTGGQGKVLIVTYDDGSVASSTLRIKGFREEMELRHPGMEIRGYVFAPDLQALIDVADMAEKEMDRHPDINAVYIANPGNYSICERLQKKASERGQRLCVITNDLVDERQKQMLRDEVITATICQEPERQGARSLQILYEAIAYGNYPEPAWEKTKLEILIGESLL